MTKNSLTIMVLTLSLAAIPDINVRADRSGWVTLFDGKTLDGWKVKSGFIGLQVHGIARDQGPYQVRWRDVRIKELKPGEEVSSTEPPDGFKAVFIRQNLVSGIVRYISVGRMPRNCPDFTSSRSCASS